MLTVVAVAALAALAACSDSGPTPPGARGDAQTARPDSSASAPHDTAITHNPQTPVATFTLHVLVGVQHVNGTDTLALDPLPGATVTLAQRTYTATAPTTANGDTLTITDVPVATATTDASGTVTFANVKNAANYVVKAVAPGGSGLAGTSALLPLETRSEVSLTMRLLPK